MQMVYKYIFLCFIIFPNTIYSQSVKIDSLKTELQNHKQKDTTRVKLLNLMADTYRSNDVSKAEQLVNEANDLSKELNFDKGIAMSTLIYSKIHISKSQFDDAKVDALKALQLFEKSNDSEFKDFIAVYNTLGMISNYKNNYDEGLEYFKKGKEIAVLNKDLIQESKMLSNIGVTFFKKGDIEQATAYYKKSIAICDKLNLPMNCLPDLNNLAIIYSIQGKFEEALAYYNKILISHRLNKNKKGIGLTTQNMGILYSEMEQYDKARIYFTEALQIHKELDNQLNIALSLNSLGSTLIELKEYKKGLELLKEGLELNEKINNNDALITSHNAIGKVNVKLKQHKLALVHFKSALKLSESVNDDRNIGYAHVNLAEVYIILKEYTIALEHANKGKKIVDKLNLLTVQIKVNKALSDIYSATKNYKSAFESYQQYKLLNDSLFNEKNIKKISQIEAEYKYKQALDSASIKELKLTKTVLSTSQDLEKTQRNYLWAIIGVLLISFISVIAIFYQKLRTAKAISQNAIIEQKLLRSQMTPHFMFNSLSVLQGMILNKEESKSVGYLSKFSKLLRITLENSRDKAVLLSKELEAVDNYLSLQNIENDKINFKLSVDDTIETNTIQVPPMLIQPFVENAIEHAFIIKKEDCRIEINLSLVDSKLICIILDNGIGIDSSERHTNQNKKSLATKITSERLQYLSKDFKMNGSVTIEDRSKFNEQGTKVTIQIPFLKQEV